MPKSTRSPGQTLTAFSLDKPLFDRMEAARHSIHMDRSNFVRMCIAKELDRMESHKSIEQRMIAAEAVVKYETDRSKKKQ